MISYSLSMTKQIETIVVGPFAVNCYLYYDNQTKTGLIIDPGAEAERIIERVNQLEIKPAAILLTHGHGDHIAGVEEIKNKFNLPLYVGDGEQSLLANPSENVSAFLGTPIIAPEPDHLLKHDDLLTFGKIELKVIATPGHSKGGVCYLEENLRMLICGDTLFAGSIGRTDLPGGSMSTLLESIHNQILTLPDEVICYPGHGPSTTVGAERNNNPFLIGGSFA